MKKLLSGTAGLFVLLFLISPVSGSGYSEVYHSGTIDWSRGVAVSVGTAFFDSRNGRTEKARTAAANDAVHLARANLLDLVGKIKMDSLTTIRNRMQQSESLGSRIQDLVKNLPPKSVQFSGNGRVEATIVLLLTGALSDIVLPQEIYSSDPLPPDAAETGPGRDSFTGMVVDCTGIRLRPSMSPTIFDEGGKLVYGASFIHRESAVQKRAAGYATDFSAAEKDERVAPKPLVVKGIRAAKSGPSDIVISNSDAARVRGSAHHLKLLQRCRVVIVLE